MDTKNVDAQGDNKNNAKNSDPDTWYDIAVSFEFKGCHGDDEHKDDDKKVVWSRHRVMRSDPCCRAVFGVTRFTCRGGHAPVRVA